MRARAVQALLIGLCVMFPVFSLVDVREAKFPVLVRLIYALEEALSLLVLQALKTGRRAAKYGNS
jgi:hypothetical protein